MAIKKSKKSKKSPTPTNKALYNRVKAEAKRKFDVYPSAYANAWLDIGAPKKKGKFQPCGRKSTKDTKRAYPKCVPRSKAKSMTEAQRKSAVRRKRAAGNPGGKPTNVRTFARKKNGSKKVSKS